MPTVLISRFVRGPEIKQYKNKEAFALICGLRTLGIMTSLDVQYVQRFRVRYGLLGSEAGRGRLILLGRKSVSDSKTLYLKCSEIEILLNY